MITIILSLLIDEHDHLYSIIEINLGMIRSSCLVIDINLEMITIVSYSLIGSVIDDYYRLSLNERTLYRFESYGISNH